MPGGVFLTGGSGFVGQSVVAELLSRCHPVNALVHRGKILSADPAVHEIEGSLFDPKALDEGVKGCDSVIHLVGIIMEDRAKGVTFERMHFEGTRAVVDAAKRNGVRRYVQMSALGTRPNAASQYHRTKWKAEEYVRGSGLDWTILRPSMIHGSGGFMKTEAQWARKETMPYIGMPYFGSGLFGLGGAGKLQPIFVTDVARAFVDALDKRKTIGQTYDLAGPDQLTWPQFHELASEQIVGHKRPNAPFPAWLAKLLATAGLGTILNFNRDQVIMSQEDNIADTTSFRQDFGWKPTPFRVALKEYASEL